MAASEKAPAAICDAGPLIHRDELGFINLLIDFPSVLVPSTVWGEVEKHRPSALNFPGILLQRSDELGAISPELSALSQALSLHAGEQQALAIAAQNPGCLLLTDDSAARLAAVSLKISVHGTIGILLRALRRNRKSKEDVLDVLRSIRERSTLHISEALLNEVIREVEIFKNAP